VSIPSGPVRHRIERAANGAATSSQEAEMRYMLLIYGDESQGADVSEAEQQAIMQKWFAYDREMREAGVTNQGEALQPTPTATSVRVNGGQPLVTDGPFAETREQLGGYYVLDVESLDEATELAARIPGAAHGAVELRPAYEENS